MASIGRGERIIVHIIPDNKFIDMAYREFESHAPNQNRLVIIGKPRTLQYVKSPAVEFCTGRDALELIGSERCSAVIFHTLTNLPLLPKIPQDKRVFWIGWGFDYYDRLLANEFPQGLYLPDTKTLVEEERNKLIPRALRAASVVKRVLQGRTSFGNSNGDRAALARVDYFLPVLDTEYESALRLNSWFTPRYLEWNYGNVEDDLGGGDIESFTPGENILLGNSAEPSNNHAEALDLIDRHVELASSKIIVPLSYGQEWYKDKIVALGRRKFGDRFVPLLEYLDNESYIEMLKSCGYVFMNHLRQQAMGNICIMMLNGAKIYMQPESPATRWLLKKGCTVESTQTLNELGDGEKLALVPLDAIERQVNASVVMAHWGRVAKRLKTRHFVDVALRVRE